MVADLNEIFKKKGETVSRAIAGETILVPLRGKLADMQQIFSMNRVAVFLWEQLDGERPVRAMVESVIERFEITRDEAERDIQEYLQELLKANLIEAVE